MTPIPSSQKLSGAIQITSTSPKNNETSVGIYYPIKVSFSSPLSETEKKSIILTLSPEATGDITWSTDNKTIIFTPSDPFQNSKQYTATLSDQKNRYSWTFTVVSVENTSYEDQVRIQEKADQVYLEWEKTVDKTYPWLEKLPLQTDNYFFYFDIDKKAFFGELYPKVNSPTSIDDQVDTLKQEIIVELNTLGIPTTPYPINWEITPE